MKDFTLDMLQIDRLSDVILKNPAIIDSDYLLKINKSASFLSYIIKELYEFVSRRAPNGVLIRDIQKRQNNLKIMKRSIDKLNTFL